MLTMGVSSSLSQSIVADGEMDAEPLLPMHSLTSVSVISPSTVEVPHSRADSGPVFVDATDLSAHLFPVDRTAALAAGLHSGVDTSGSASGLQWEWGRETSSCARFLSRASTVRGLPCLLEVHTDAVADSSVDHTGGDASRSLPSFSPIDAALDAGVDNTSAGCTSAATIRFSPRHSAVGAPFTRNGSLAASRWTQMSVREWAAFGCTSASLRNFSGHAGTAVSSAVAAGVDFDSDVAMGTNAGPFCAGGIDVDMGSGGQTPISLDNSSALPQEHLKEEW